MITKWAISLVLICLVVLSAVYFLRPYWIDSQIDKKVELLEVYLEKLYPNDDWLITTVHHREAGYNHLNPYYIGVVFQNEQDVIYHYWVENKDNIYQISYSTNKPLDDLMYIEREKGLK